MLLVDSNIVFCLFISSTPWHRSARELYASDGDWRTEAHALVEVSNALSRYVRVRELTGAQALTVMADADQRLRPRLLTVSHVEALRMSLKHKVSAYDARFLLCAVDLGVRLVTEDVKLRNAAPSLTLSLQDALAARTWTHPCPALKKKPTTSN